MIDTLNEGRLGNSGGGFLGGQYLINCYTSFIRNDDKVYYAACPDENCRRKVIEETTGTFRCENCNKSHDSCLPTFMLSAKIADQSSNSIFVNFYRDQGQQLMGAITAAEIKQLREDGNTQAVCDAFFDAQFQHHQIMVKARVNQPSTTGYDNGAERIQFFAGKVLPHSFSEENRELLRRLEIYKTISQVQAE